MLFGLAGATLLTQAVVLERAVSEAPRAIAACRYPSLAVTNQAAAEKKGSSLSIRSYNLSLSARVALAEPPTSKVCNNSDKGPSFPLKSIISSTDFPRLNSVSSGFMRISA